MGLHAGNTNNPNGRPVGSKNKINSDLRERINNFLNDNWENIQKDFDNLEPKEKLMFFEKLLQYSLPRLKNVEIASELDTAIVPIKITREEMKEISERLEREC